MDALAADGVLARARDGDAEAFRVLVEAHARRAFALAFRLVGNEQDADDVVQESFIRAHRRLRDFESRANFGTWFHRIVVNCAIDSLRSRKARREDGQAEVLDAAADVTPSSGPSPERLAQSAEIRRRVEASLDTLTAQERAAFALRHYEGCSIDEISRTLHIQESAAKHAVFRAVRKLRAVLEPLRGHA
jgi:RNA polymerase sigma-70 factor (ECF subfamily)